MAVWSVGKRTAAERVVAVASALKEREERRLCRLAEVNARRRELTRKRREAERAERLAEIAARPKPVSVERQQIRLLRSMSARDLAAHYVSCRVQA